MAQSPCRPCQPRPTEGDVGDRALSHGGTRRPCRALCGVRLHHDRLQLLPQPALPEVPRRRRQGLACRPRSQPVAGAVLSRRVHAPCGRRRHRLSEQGRDLRSFVQGLGRDHADDRRRSEAPRRQDRHHLRAPHLGISAHPSPARAYDCPGRRHLARRPALGFLPAGILPAGARALPPVQAPVPSEAHCRRTKPDA